MVSSIEAVSLFPVATVMWILSFCVTCIRYSTSQIWVERPARRKSKSKQSRCNKMDLHQLPGSLYSSPQLYSITARRLDQDPSSCSADYNMIEKLICTLPDRTENTPLYLYPQHGPSLQLFT